MADITTKYHAVLVYSPAGTSPQIREAIEEVCNEALKQAKGGVLGSIGAWVSRKRDIAAAVHPLPEFTQGGGAQEPEVVAEAIATALVEYCKRREAEAEAKTFAIRDAGYGVVSPSLWKDEVYRSAWIAEIDRISR